MANVYVDSNAVGSGTGADWANAYTTIGAALAAKAAGDDFWVAHDHAESSASAISWTDIKGTFASPVRIICVNKAGSVPPVSADLRLTATVTTTGNSGITLNTTSSRSAYIYGISFNIGTGANGPQLFVSTATSSFFIMEKCVFNSVATGGTLVRLQGSSDSRVYLKNCDVSFASTNASIYVGTTYLEWRGGALLAGSAIPTTLFQAASNSHINKFIGLDLSKAGSGKTLFGIASSPADVIIQDCKINASATLVSRSTNAFAGRVILDRVDSGTAYYRTETNCYQGDQQTSTSVVRTGGAYGDGSSTPISWKCNNTTNTRLVDPFEILPISIFNSTTGSSITVTLEGLADPTGFSAIPTDLEFWLEAEYLGTSGNPLGVWGKSQADILTTSTTASASSAVWDSAATAWAQSTAYTVGTIRKAGNQNKIFIVTSVSGTGTSGTDGTIFNTVSDGATVTDNAGANQVVWKCFYRFSLSISFTPQAVGKFTVYPKLGGAGSARTIYLDPMLTISGVTIGKTYIGDSGMFINELGSTGGSTAYVIGS